MTVRTKRGASRVDLAADDDERENPTSQRIIRELTPEEQARIEQARTETEAQREAIMAAGRLHKLKYEGEKSGGEGGSHSS